MTTRRRPLPRSRQALRSREASVRDLWEFTDKPANIEDKVKEFKAWQERKKAGALEMYTGTLRRGI